MVTGSQKAEVKLQEFDPEITKQIERAENFQLTVAVAIIAQYISVSSNNISLFFDLKGVLSILAFISFIFLAMKMMIITTRPFYYPRIVQYTDYFILPGTFLFIFLWEVVITSISILNSSSIINRLLDFDSFSLVNIPSGILIGVAILLSLYLSYRYGEETSEKMSTLETTVPDVKIHFTSGPSGRSFPLTLKNQSEYKRISKEDIRIYTIPTEGVDVDISPAEQLSDGSWQPLLNIKPDNRIQLQLNFTRPEHKEEISEETVDIITEFKGKPQKKYTVSLEG